MPEGTVQKAWIFEIGQRQISLPGDTKVSEFRFQCSGLKLKISFFSSWNLTPDTRYLPKSQIFNGPGLFLLHSDILFGSLKSAYEYHSYQDWFTTQIGLSRSSGIPSDSEGELVTSLVSCWLTFSSSSPRRSGQTERRVVSWQEEADQLSSP